MYKEWAQGQSDKIKNILNSAREDHTNAVKARMENVRDLGGVIDITKDLFAVSKVCTIIGGTWIGRTFGVLTGCCRKQHNSRAKRMSSSRRLHWLMSARTCSIRG